MGGIRAYGRHGLGFVQDRPPKLGFGAVQGSSGFCRDVDPAEVPSLPREDYLQQNYQSGLVRCTKGVAMNEIVASNFDGPIGNPTGDANDFPLRQFWCPPQ